jgi:hypothetical protein
VPVTVENSHGATLQLKITGTYEHKSRNLAPPGKPYITTGDDAIEMSDSEEAEDRNSTKSFDEMNSSQQKTPKGLFTRSTNFVSY